MIQAAITPPPAEDLSALAWVHDEVRRSLESAHKALRRYIRESESSFMSDVDAVDPAVLRQARAQLHQAVGALELVGLPPATTLLRASEAAVSRLIAKPALADITSVETIEKASFALLDFLARKLAGKPVSALSMFPQYRAVQALAGADRVHPADLWFDEVGTAELGPDALAPARGFGDDLRSDLETQTLALLRQPRGPAAERISDLYAALGNGRAGQPDATLWHLAAAFFEGQAKGLVPLDVYAKRIASRLLAQLRLAERAGDAAPALDCLRRDLLFFCSQAGVGGDGAETPRLAAARRAFGLTGRAATDYENASLGRFDPAWVAQARKRVAAAKDAWSAAAGGEMQHAMGLGEQFALVADSLRRLFPQGELLGEALHGAAADAAERGAPPPPEVAMEVATALLWIDAALDDGEFDHPQQAHRVQRLAQRIALVRAGSDVGALDDWMEELYRRVSDRQTMGSVVHELRASLAEAEKLIDQYFRDPTQRASLAAAPAQLQAMRGVFSVLGVDEASQAVLRMRDDVDALLVAGETGATDTQAWVDRLATNLGALGFLIDMLSVQPALAKSLFHFDAEAGLLRSRVGTSSRAPAEDAAPQAALIEQAQSLAQDAVRADVDDDEVRRSLERLSQQALVADQAALAEAASRARSALARADDDVARHQAREQIAKTMADLVAASAAPAVEAPAPVPVPPPAAPAAEGHTGLEDDAEMREIFLDEAREVMAGAREALAALSRAPEDLAELTTVRRAFHTLKGSSRMVGLNDFGEAGWACEQLYNARLAEAPRADDDLLGFTYDALAYLGDWVEAIAQRRDGGHRSQPVRAAADAMRTARRREPLVLPGAAAPAAPRADELPELPLDDAIDTRPAALADGPVLTDVVEPVPDEAAIDDSFADLAIETVEAVAVDEPVAPAPGEGADTEPMPLADAASQGPVVLETFELSLPPTVEAPGAAPMTVGWVAGEATAAAPVVESPLVEPITLDLPAEPEPPAPAAVGTDADQYKAIGSLRVSIALFNIYLNEADELSRRLATELAEWSHELHRALPDAAVAQAHSLAGSSATVGFDELSNLARALEHALMRTQALGEATPAGAALFVEAADEVRRMLHQFAAGFLPSAPAELLERLAEHEREASERLRQLTQTGDLGTLGGLALGDEPPADAVTTSFAVDVVEADEPAEPAEPAEPMVPLIAIETPAEPASEPAAPATLDSVEPAAAAPAEAPQAPAAPRETAVLHTLPPVLGAVSVQALDSEEDIDAVDAVDAELFPIFEEEANELLPQLAARLRDWQQRPGDAGGAAACMRTLHTFKGGARLAGAMRVGELAHRLETAIERLVARGDVQAHDVEALQVRADHLGAAFEALRATGGAPAAAAGPATALAVPLAAAVPLTVEQAATPPTPATVIAAAAATAIDWSRFAGGAVTTGGEAAAAAATTGSGAVRVRVPLLDRMVNQAGEVSITRSRIEAEVNALKASLADLSDNLERLRRQLRDLELQAETQIASRMEQAKAAAQEFDPLEFDRFTRFQELTRMMAESVNDVATVQRSLQHALQAAEDDLAAQARLTRDLQDDLLRTRMVEFESLSERLYRVVRQAAKETGKQVRLDIVGGSIEVDRGVLDRMTPAFEHLLRNCVTHGIETPDARVAAGKDATGQITVVLRQEGNEVAVEFRDDGAGLNLARIRERGVALGLVAPDAEMSDAEIAQLIYTPGFSTAEQVTELAGRGVGMDVVRSEVVAMGGRIETATAAGQGTSFKLVLPLTTAVTQVVMLRCGDTRVAVPSTLIELVKRVPADSLEPAYREGAIDLGGDRLPFFWLGALLDESARSAQPARNATLVVVRSAQQRVVLHVDEVVGNQEAVVKNLGPQLSRLPGLAGMTLLASGMPALIYNPVALAAVYGDAARERMRAGRASQGAAAATVGTGDVAPLVLVVDDSLTVRRVTQRLLVREGYRVALAKDGLEALERLADEMPAVVLSDIEMPRMDGFDLVRNLRADARWRHLPVIMITSRIAQKHRDVAAQLGVDHYLGKPYSEDELLELVGRHARLPVAA
ncbi:Hpt domain-containing protein [Calidifontimicrobium sp. SYSU G02091]|uniref:Hpt domain-containing protein n=1 Tax=Calidifontimicrobium sp. SYSU G02091 TaxID=2926421 RepID=UPI001F5363C2|nr:Hpt domain-containing protein [Calidifontimicrobium sp. SYSU G02091]MCI1190715.1 Hpt domain-containing protein [Calidifontimicrobium sp. SYSU G02091]